MNKTSAGPKGTRTAGTIYEIDDKEAEALIKARIADKWTRSEPTEEKASAPEPEKAVKEYDKKETSSKKNVKKKAQHRSTKAPAPIEEEDAE